VASSLILSTDFFPLIVPLVIHHWTLAIINAVPDFIENWFEFPKRRKGVLPRSASPRQHGLNAPGRTADRWIAGLQPPKKSRQRRYVFIKQQSAHSQEYETLQDGKKKADESQDDQQAAKTDSKKTIHMVLRPVSTLSNSVTLQRVIASILTKKRAAAGLSQIYGPKAVESGLSQAKGHRDCFVARAGESPVTSATLRSSQ